MSNIFIPTITTITDGREHNMDILSYEFIKNREVWLNGEVNSESARIIASQLRYLGAKSDEEIKLFINSPGGSVSDGMMILDAMNSISAPVATICTGLAASMGAFLLSCGAKGRRFSAENCEIMIHQPLGGTHGQATDICIAAEHIKKIKLRLASQLAINCNKGVEEVMGDLERDFWMSSDDALKYGIVDHIGFPD